MMQTVTRSLPCAFLFRTRSNAKSSLCFIRRGKKTKSKSKKSSCDYALDHFDTFYRPMYGEFWPSIRISLLTTKKSCAVLNSFTDTEAMRSKLEEVGAYDMIEDAADTLEEAISEVQDVKEKDDGIQKDEGIQSHVNFNREESNLKGDGTSFLNDTEGLQPNFRHDAISFEAKDGSKNGLKSKPESDFKSDNYTDLDIFVPAKNVYSERDTLQMDDAETSRFTPADVRVNFTKNTKWTIPEDLQVMVYPQGDISEFPDPKGSLLTHFMMDAASVLPVIALDLQKDDHVLDLCAAPGGKTLAILQTQLPEKLMCNDLSLSRLKRLQNIVRYYLPEEAREVVETSNKDGRKLNVGVYDKVLVDVPCNTDRHVLSEPDNNLFTLQRTRERIDLPILQKDLLLAGIKACAPGGSVVYSTCTLSFAQNDGVVQQVIDEIWKSTNIDIMVEDLEPMQTMFKNTLNFYTGCRFGQLVIPTLSSNFGPMYFCKIKRMT